jgi:hypothetical protein
MHDVDGWWDAMEHDVLRCLEGRDAVAPAVIADELGISEAAATSLLAILARDGKVRIRAVSSEDASAA